VVVGDLMADLSASLQQDSGLPQGEWVALLPGSKRAKLQVGMPFLMAAADRLAALPRLEVVVTLGDVARRNLMRALGLPASAGIPGHGAEFTAGPYRVINSYHCSRLNTNTGRLTPEMFEAIFRRARSLLDG
jgi:hypothetical protein